MFQHHKNFDKIFRYTNFLWPFAPYLTWGVVNCGFVNFIWRKLLIYRRSWLRCVVFSCVSVLDILPAHLSGKFCQLSGHSTILPSIHPSVRPSVRLFVRSLVRSFVCSFVRSVFQLLVRDWPCNKWRRKKTSKSSSTDPPPPLSPPMNITEKRWRKKEGNRIQRLKTTYLSNHYLFMKNKNQRLQISWHFFNSIVLFFWQTFLLLTYLVSFHFSQ